MKLAELQCLSCSAVWKQAPGPASCPACGAVYTKWMNYMKDFIRSENKKMQ